MLAPLREQIAEDIVTRDSESDALELIDQAVDSFSDSEVLARAIMRPSAQVDLAGQLVVHDVEAGTGIELSRYRWRLDGSNFLSMPWPEAIAAFRDRGLISESELERLLAGYEARSAEARQLLLDHLRKVVRDELLRTLEDGGTFAEFAEAITTEQISFGIGGADQHYLETVYRTNLQTAYGAGRFRAINDPDVQAARPYWQCRSVRDDRVAVTPCQVLAGRIFRVGNSETDPIYPPNHFNCRCAAVSLSREQLRDREVNESVPTGGDPQTGFAVSPAALVAQSLNLSRRDLRFQVERDEALAAGGELMAILMEATGLEAAELLAAVRDDIDALADALGKRSDEDGTKAENIDQ